jgi:periplasmic divalent cation tolerance protein
MFRKTLSGRAKENKRIVTEPVDDILVVFVTAGSEAEAEEIARMLLEESLVACANILPAVRSIYRWKGVVEDERETLLILKTERTRLGDVKKRIREIHSYEVPEIIAVPVVGGLRAYLEWVRAEVGRDRRPGAKD